VSIDFIIRWKKQGGKWTDPSGLSLRPKKKELLIALEDFFRGIGTIEDISKQQRFYITLSGQPCNPSSRLVPDNMKYLFTQVHSQRWIEVYYGDRTSNINVITRRTDEITLAIARGFAATFVARFWQAEFDDPG
jgi:hypothetical protein